MSIRRKITFVVLAVLGLLAGMIALTTPVASNGSRSICISLSRRTTNTVGEAVVIAQFTNSSLFAYNYFYISEAFTNGQWQEGGLHHPQMRQAEYLGPHGSRTVELKVVDHAATICRLKLGAGRVPIGTEEKVLRLWWRIGGKYWPFTRSFCVFSPQFEMAR